MYTKKFLVAAICCSALSSLPLWAGEMAQGKSRAEVQEELAQARADGSYACIDSDLVFECANRVAIRQMAVKKAPQIGRWLTQSGQLEVEIAACGQALCGTVVKVTDSAADASAAAMGLKVLSGLTPVSAKEWKGRIYNRGDGASYDCLMSLANPDELRIIAYQTSPANGREQIWSRLQDVSSH